MVKRGIQILIGIILVCIVFEVILQFTDSTNYSTLPIDPASGLNIHTPNTSYVVSKACYTNTVVINNLGFHGPAVETAKPADVFRIVVVGSSFVEAEQVSVADMFTSVLQNELNSMPGRTVTYEVTPLGFSANGTYLDTLYYERFGESLKPDLVIDFETEYEFQFGRGSPTFDKNGDVILTLPISTVSESPLMTTIKNTYHKSKLIMNILTQYTLLKQSEGAFFAHPNFFGNIEPVGGAGADAAADTSAATEATSSDDTLWTKEDALTDGLVRTVRASGAQFLLTSWATPGATPEGADELATRLEAVAVRDNFPYLNLDSTIAADEASTSESAVWSCDNHWSATGHADAGEAIYQYLVAHPQLITPQS